METNNGGGNTMSWYEVELLNLAAELAALSQHGSLSVSTPGAIGTRFRAAIARLDRCTADERAAVIRAAEGMAAR